MPSRFKIRRWTREVRPMLALAMPIVAGMLGQMLIGLTDTIMVGHVGVVPLAASAFVIALAHLPLVFGIGLLSSVAVLAAQAYGARRDADSGEVLRHGLVLGAAVGIASAVFLLALKPVLSWFGQPKEVIGACGPFLNLIALSLAPIMIAQVCKQFSESSNRPWVPSFIMLGGVLTNIVLNWAFIYGHLGASAMGLEGSGWATLIARSLIAIALIIYACRASALRAFMPVCWRAKLRLGWFKDLLHIGGPVGAQHLLEVGAFVCAALMIGWMGADAIAAHQIAITCAATSFMFALGTGMASCIRVGHAWGAGQFARVRRIGFLGVALSAITMMAFGVLFVTAGQPLARLFTTSPSVTVLTAQLLMVAALFQLADAVQVSAISALRGISDVRIPALIAGMAYWVVAIPLGYVLAFPAGLGTVGMWIGLATGLGGAAAGLSWRFHCKTRHQPSRQISLTLAAPVQIASVTAGLR